MKGQWSVPVIASILILGGLGLILPVYAYESASDEQKERELRVQECIKKVMEDDSLTVAEKSVKKNKCQTEEMAGEMGNFDEPDRELQQTFQDVAECESWFEQYDIAGESNFLRVHNDPLARECVLLYKDRIWAYEGEDRLEKLVERYFEIIKAEFEAGAESRAKNTTA